MAIAAGCGQPSERATPTPTASTPSAGTATPSPPQRKPVCALLPSSDVDPILGTTTTAEAEGGGNTTCTYTAAGALAPPLKIEIDRGGGEAAMMASGMLKRAEPGIADELAGLGDAATRIGPSIWVRVGEDLVMLTFFGVDDSVAAAKRIMAILRPRL